MKFTFTVKRKALQAEAVEFTGKNGRALKDWLEGHPAVAGVKNGGSWVKVLLENGLSFTLKKGNVIIFDKVEGVLVYNAEDFAALYNR